MSLQNLLKENNYNLYCGEVNADKFDVGTVIVDNIQVNNAVVLNQITTPSITSGTSLFNTVGTIDLDAINITATNNIVAPIHFATSSMNTPSISNGVNPVAMSTGLTLPNTNAAGTTNLKYYLQSTGVLTTSGAVVMNLNYRATRIGGQVNVCVQCMDTSVLATANTFLTISGTPLDFLPNSTTCCGPILTNTATGVTLGRYQFNGSGDLIIFASLTGGVNFAIGQPCGLFGGTAQFATFTFSRTP